MKGVAVYNTAGATLAITSGLAPAFRSRPTTVSRAAQEGTGVGEFLGAEQVNASNPEEAVPIHIYALPLHSNGEMAGTLALFHDTNYIDQQVSRPLRDSLLIGILLPASAAWSQDGVSEQRAIGGNSATIVGNVRDSSGGPLPVSAIVKLFQSQGIPNGQSTTSQGRVIFLPQNLGGFFVVVEAPGYKPGRANANSANILKQLLAP